MAEPLITRAPGNVLAALRSLQAETSKFAAQAIEDAGTRRQYLENTGKFARAILADVRANKLSADAAAREIRVVLDALAGLGVATNTLPALQAGVQAATERVAGHRWCSKGTMTAAEAFGHPALADDAWVHLAPARAAQSIRSSGITTSSHSSWARWGEVKGETFGAMVFKIGPMAASAESDMGILAVAAKDAAIREVKGLYGFKVEGAATTTIATSSVVESTYVRSLIAAERAAGKTLAQLEELVAARRFSEVVATRSRGQPGVRVFDRLTQSEKAEVMLEIVETVHPSKAPPPPPAVGRWAKIGRCLVVVSIGIAVYRVATAEDTLKQASRETVGFGGGVAGGMAAGATVSAFAPEAAPLIIGLSALVGGILGALGADFVFEWADGLSAPDLDQHY